MNHYRWGLGLIVLALAACSSAPQRGVGSADGAGAGTVVSGKAECPPGSPYAPASEDPSTRGHYTAGGLYRPGTAGK